MNEKRDPNEAQFIQKIRTLVRSSALSFLSRGLQQFGKRIQEWTILREEADDVDMSFQNIGDNSLFRKADPEIWKGADCVVGNLKMVNSAWRLWGALGGAISKILEAVESPSSDAEYGSGEDQSLDDM